MESDFLNVNVQDQFVCVGFLRKIQQSEVGKKYDLFGWIGHRAMDCCCASVERVISLFA